MESNKYYKAYKECSNIKDKEKESFDYLITDLMVKDLYGADKSHTISAQNMEQKMPTNFVPTMFYIFMYATPEQQNGGFYDVCPLILCLSCNRTTVTGINFNLLPNDLRARFLDILTGDFQEFYDDIEKTADDNDEPKINKMFGNGVVSQKGVKALLQYMTAKTNINMSSCVRQYDRRFIFKTRMLEYDDWEYITFLSFKDAVRGASLAKLQADLIIKNQINSLKR